MPGSPDELVLGPAHFALVISAILLGTLPSLASIDDSCLFKDDIPDIAGQNCTSNTEAMYAKIVDEIIAGNDSGAPQLCREYSLTEKCLHDIFDDCGTRGKLKLRSHLALLQKTVGKYCEYLQETNQMSGDEQGSSASAQNSGMALIIISRKHSLCPHLEALTYLGVLNFFLRPT